MARLIWGILFVIAICSCFSVITDEIMYGKPLKALIMIFPLSFNFIGFFNFIRLKDNDDDDNDEGIVVEDSANMPSGMYTQTL